MDTNEPARVSDPHPLPLKSVWKDRGFHWWRSNGRMREVSVDGIEWSEAPNDEQP